MFRRIIGLMLVAAMLFSFPVFAEDTAVATSEVMGISEIVPDSGNVAFAKAMGLFAVSDTGDMPLTRGAFAKMFCAITRYDINLAGAAGVKFADVPGELTAAVAEVSNMGIMSGVSDTMFMPDSNVTYAQALKAMVTFLGYKDYAEVKGGFPYGYYIQAQEIGLIKNSPSDINVEITYEKAAELFKLGLNVPYRRPYAYSEDVKHEVVKNLTYLEYHRNILITSGTVNATETIDLAGRGTTLKGQVKIGTRLFEFEGADLSKLAGYNVVAYYYGETNKIFYFEIDNTNVVTIDDSDLGDLVTDGSKQKLEYYTEDGKYKHLNVKGARLIYNGKLCPSYTEDDVNPFLATNMDGNVVVIDNNGDSVYETIIVNAYQTYVIDKIVGDVIYTKYRNGEFIDLRNIDLEEKGRILNVNGDPVKATSIAAERIISVSRSKDGEIIEMVVTADTYTGRLEGTRVSNGKTYLKIDGNLFETSNAVKLNPYFGSLVLGAKIKVMFNKEALISDVDQRTVAEYQNAYLIDYIDTDFGFGGYEALIRVFGADGVWYTLKLADKITVNDGSSIESREFDTIAAYESNGRLKRQPVRYTFDEDGNVKKLYIAHTKDGMITDTTKPFFIHKNFTGVANTVDKYLKNRNIAGKLIVAPNAVTFSVPAEEDRDDFDGYFIRPLTDTRLYYRATAMPWEAYGSKDRPAADIMVFKGREKGRSNAITDTDYGYIVKSVEEILDDEGNEAHKITAISGSTVVEYIDTEDVFLIGPGGTLPDVGDVIRVKSRDGKYVKAYMYYDASEGQVYAYSGEEPTTVADKTYTSKSITAASRFAVGTVIYCDGEIMTVKFTPTAVDGSQDEANSYTYTYYLSGFRYNKVYKSGKETVVEKATVADIIGENQGVAMGSKILIQSTGYNHRLIVIYVD